MLHFNKWDQNPFVSQDIYLIVPSDTNTHGQHIPLAKQQATTDIYPNARSCDEVLISKYIQEA